jgi:hypothetical protein
VGAGRGLSLCYLLHWWQRGIINQHIHYCALLVYSISSLLSLLPRKGIGFAACRAT